MTAQPGATRRTRPSRHARRRLTQLFERNGYIRVPREHRRLELGRDYKKGWEVRLVLKSQDELDEVRRLLDAADLKAGRPFRKVNQWVQPIYGRKHVDLFLSWAAKARAGSSRD